MKWVLFHPKVIIVKVEFEDLVFRINKCKRKAYRENKTLSSDKTKH
jgi:hypothetical protein